MPSPFTPVSRANYFYDTSNHIPYPQTFGFRLNNCNNTLCYTYNHNYVYKKNTGYGKVGTTASSYLASRKRL